MVAEMAAAERPLFVMVTLCGVSAVPTYSLPKESDVGETETLPFRCPWAGVFAPRVNRANARTEQRPKNEKDFILPPAWLEVVFPLSEDRKTARVFPDAGHAILGGGAVNGGANFFLRTANYLYLRAGQI